MVQSVLFASILVLGLMLGSPATAEYKTLFYQGSNYTYAGDEVDSYNGTLQWCRSLGGTLPSIHSDADRRFLGDVLVGRHRNYESIFLGATFVSGTWKWDDGTTVSDDFPEIKERLCSSSQCCGLVMWTDQDIDYHRHIWSVNICSERNRRKVCRLKPGMAVVDHTITPPSTTPSPFAVLSANLAAARLGFQHRKIMESVGGLKEKVDLLAESLPNEIQIKVSAHQPDQQLHEIEGQLKLLTALLCLLTIGFALMKAGLLAYRIHHKKETGRGFSMSDLLADV